MKSAAARYLRKVSRQLLCPNSIKKRFLRQLETEVRCFCADHPDADADMLSRQFGAPAEMAAEFLSELGAQAVSRYNRTRKRLRYLTFGILLTAAIFAVLLGVRISTLRQTLPEGQFVASITYEDDPEKGTSWLPSRDTIFGSKETTMP